jgi:PAT family beta-lactamase induction signal transducer AmpG
MAACGYSPPVPTPPQQQGWTRSFVSVFSTPRVLLLGALGFGSGLPLYLTGPTLHAWMAREGVDLQTIGVFSLVALPYTLKFLWAPLLDRFGLGVLGRRRGWMALSQVLLMVAIGVLGTLHPAQAPLAVASVALLVALFSATQDISADAYRTDLLPERERAAGTATFVTGYRVALIAAGAGALMLADPLGWRVVYGIMAGLMSLGLLATLRAPDPQDAPPPATLAAAIVHPFVDYFSRPAALLVLCFVVLYKCGDEVARAMITPFLVQTGFSNTEIGAINQGFGMAATIVGVLFAGGFVARMGVRRALLVFGVLQAATNAAYLLLAMSGKSYLMLWAAIGVDNLTGGMAAAAFVAFLMSLCDRRFSATQYALLSSLSALGGRLLAASSGYLAAGVGWPGFFGVTIALAVPALLLLGVLPRQLEPEPAPAPAASPAI